MQPELPKAEVAKVAEIMARSDWRKIRWTGANLIWGVENEIVRGCLEGDPDTVKEGYGRMYEEIKVVSPKEEGIQQDYSFHQHGAQLYSGGYGLTYADDVGRFIAFAWGTHFQIPPDRMAIFSAYILDGEQWMVRGDVIDYSVMGREITRMGKTIAPRDWTVGPISPAGPAYSLENVIDLLAAEPTPRQQEFQSFAAALHGRMDVRGLTGNKQFWCSDFMAHRRSSYYTSVKMLSTRMHNAESTNGEGRKSEHLSDGANFLYLTGDEYKDIFSVWDWTKVPGTTAIQGTLDTGEKNAIGALGGSAFAGGVSDGRYGMAAMDLQRGHLTAEKAWFFFDDEYVCLGARITLTGSNNAVATDVNQTLLNGPALSDLSTGAVSPGSHTYILRSSSWFYHDHAGYIFGPGAHVSLSVGAQTGRWSDIGSGSSEPVTRNVFDLWIDHGVSPSNGSYQYVVLAGASSEETARRSRHPQTRILANNATIQAVWNKHIKVGMFAFHEAGSLATPVGTITVDHPSLVMLRRISRHWQISVSNPENDALTLHVKVANRQITMPLPRGNFAGSSVTTPLNHPPSTR
jgi:chondroitin AC lyase